MAEIIEKRPATKGYFARTITEIVYEVAVMNAELKGMLVKVAIPESTPAKQLNKVLSEAVSASYAGYHFAYISGEGVKRSTLYGMPISEFMRYAKPLGKDGETAEGETAEGETAEGETVEGETVEDKGVQA